MFQHVCLFLNTRKHSQVNSRLTPCSRHLLPAFSFWRTRGAGICSRGCSSATISRPDLPACLLCLRELSRCQRESQVLSSLLNYTDTWDHMKGEERSRSEARGCVRTRSENSQPTPEATNFCGSAIAARKQLLLIWIFLPRQISAVLFGKPIMLLCKTGSLGVFDSLQSLVGDSKWYRNKVTRWEETL